MKLKIPNHLMYLSIKYNRDRGNNNTVGESNLSTKQRIQQWLRKINSVDDSFYPTINKSVHDAQVKISMRGGNQFLTEKFYLSWTVLTSDLCKQTNVYQWVKTF